jgi:hypothetical protein
MRATGQFELAALIRQQRDVLLSTWRQQVRQLPSARNLDTSTLNDHIPQLLDELVDALNSSSDQKIPEALARGSPPVHGLERFREGYDIEAVVTEYNNLRGCIHDLTEKNGLSLDGDLFHIVNGVLDRAIGLAVQTYATASIRVTETTGRISRLCGARSSHPVKCSCAGCKRSRGDIPRRKCSRGYGMDA